MDVPPNGCGTCIALYCLSWIACVREDKGGDGAADSIRGGSVTRQDSLAMGYYRPPFPKTA